MEVKTPLRTPPPPPYKLGEKVLPRKGPPPLPLDCTDCVFSGKNIPHSAKKSSSIKAD